MVTSMKTATLSTLAVLFAVPMVAVLAQAGDATADHQEMMAKLDITTPLRPGPAGRLNADGSAPANYANYDETKATAKSPVPPLLVMNDGRKITTPAMWEQHRKELFEIFDREFYGRLPEAAKTIKVTWEVTATTQGMSGNIPTITRTLVGHVDPTYYPAIKVDIAASVTTPASAAGKVPVIIQWGGGAGLGRAGGRRPADDGAVADGADAHRRAGRHDPALVAKAQQDLAATPAAAASVRTSLSDQISAVLTDAQKPLLAQALNPLAGRGGAPAPRRRCRARRRSGASRRQQPAVPERRHDLAAGGDLARLGLRQPQSRQHPGRQRRQQPAPAGHHRPHQQRRGAQSR